MSTGAILLWFNLEWWAWLSILFSNSAFQFLRAIFGKLPWDHEYGVSLPKRLPTEDTILATLKLSMFFIEECVPTCIVLFINYDKYTYQAKAALTYDAFWQNNLI